MKIKFILPSLLEARDPGFRPIKYSLFPPLGLATLAGYAREDDQVEIIDEHVERSTYSDHPDIAAIQVYITNAYRAYEIADHYRRKGVYVILGGLHVTACPQEAKRHANTIFLGPAEATFPCFLDDFRRGEPKKIYSSNQRSLTPPPLVRRDLLKRELYLVPNSIIVSRGCPHHCSFCYKDSFFSGGKSFYTQQVDHALAEIESLPGRHLYFLDDHLLADTRFASQLFAGMRGMNRVFQCAGTVESVLRGNLIEKAAEAGLRSLFIGFETLNSNNLFINNKRQNRISHYNRAANRLHDLGIMINGSFVFGMDCDRENVFHHTVEWAVSSGMTTATFHILTPYPGTVLYENLNDSGRILTRNHDLYDTRHAVFQPALMSAACLEKGYHWAYREFYKWSSIFRSCMVHDSLAGKVKHLAYTAGWKKCEPLWKLVVKMKGLPFMLPLLEALLARDSKALKTPDRVMTNQVRLSIEGGNRLK